MRHTAYLLACAGMNFYAGYTPDITRRVFLHQTGRGAKYTRSHGPVRLVYTETYATKGQAMRREAALKKLTHAQKAQLAAPALAAWEYLDERPACVDMLEALRWGKASVLAAEKGGVLLQVHGGDLLLAAGTQAAAVRLLHAAGPVAPRAMVGVHGHAAALATARFLGCPLTTACTQAVYWAAQPPHIQAPGVRFATLGPEWLQTVCTWYDLVPREDVAARLAAGTVTGAFLSSGKKRQLAGFIGEHAEGSMGMLEVLPQFRRMGIGAALEAHAIAGLLRHGRVPFCHIFAGNRASLALQKKLGLALRRDMYWLEAGQ